MLFFLCSLFSCCIADLGELNKATAKVAVLPFLKLDIPFLLTLGRHMMLNQAMSAFLEVPAKGAL